MEWHSSVAFRRISGDSSAGATTTIDFASPSAPSEWSINSFTSRPRSPISPTTTISALVWRVIIPSSTLFPTPLPAISPTRWPLPMVSRPLIAFTPTSSGSSTERRVKGLTEGGNGGRRSLPFRRPLPSSGSPRPFTTRPNQLSPIRMSWAFSSGKTRAPAIRPTGCLNGIK
ncbi:hypothetical protein BvCmsKSNP073_03635 [Escherichia coli]|nr:hypothetical protein HmCmsJML243_02102 [Escherichia coli]GDL79616.1 hypothetical protein BvCmsKSNP073_03635 [Escherichia coli]